MSDEKDGGRTIYHRRGAGGEEENRAAREEKRGVEPTTARREFGRVTLARTLAPLLVGFVLLVGLVTGLGLLSQRRLENVGKLPFDRERRLTETLNRLFNLRLALNRLESEARARDRSMPGIRPPGDLRLRNARTEVEEVLPLYEELPLAQTEKGRALRAEIENFVRMTRDPADYNQSGFVAFRGIERQISELIEEAGAQRGSISDEWYTAFDRSKREIGLLTLFAAAVGLFVAAATTWEVLRRFRQLRESFETVRRERQFSRQMIEGMVSAIAAVDRRNRLRSANASFFEIFPEARPDEVLADTVKSPETEKLLAAVTATQPASPTYYGRWRLTDAHARERAFDVYSSPLEIEGEPGQILMLVDVSEAAESERELRRRESLTAVGQATAQVAHEIKNPLGSIRLGVAMLRDMARERDAINTIDLVERGIEHLSKITSDVTLFSRQRELTLAEVDLHELLQESFDLVSDRLREKKTEVEKRYDEKPIRGQWDDDQLRQVFLNLVANAVDASPPQTPITVMTELVEEPMRSSEVGGRLHGEGGARIHVIDRGAGMDEATQRRVFEPFFTTKRRGTGLGLAIAKRIVEQHGGRISVESKAGEGTRFTVELPLSPDGAVR